MHSSQLMPGPVPDDMRLVGIELVRAHPLCNGFNAEQEALSSSSCLTRTAVDVELQIVGVAVNTNAEGVRKASPRQCQ